jgi:transposase
MRITTRTAREMLEVLDELREELFKGQKKGYPYAEWERKRELVRRRLRRLPEYVRRAAEEVRRARPGPGRPSKLDPVQRTMLFLFARLMNKSNRDTEELLELFEPLFGFRVSYKTVERLYSDEEVRLILHNLLLLLLREEGISGNFAGDGTGYSLTVTKHYRSRPKKRSKDYRYVFRLIDLGSGMYVGLGYSRRSEMDAFLKAMRMLEGLGVAVDEVSLDRYYSSRRVLRLFGKRTAVYVIPKRNISKLGFEWARVVKCILEDPVLFLEKYFRRNLSEAGFSADKRRFGWIVRQRREDRQEVAAFSIALLHNLFAVRVGFG